MVAVSKDAFCQKREQTTAIFFVISFQLLAVMRSFFVLSVIFQLGLWVPNGHSVLAQTLNFDRLTLADGLSESTVLAIAQDADGFMWFGTREGLNRYDARTIRVFRHQAGNASSLSDNFVYSLLSDRSGRLWVATRNGLNLFDPRTETFTKFFSTPDNRLSISDNTATSILQDHDGRIWIGTRGGLNLLVENDTISFFRFVHATGLKNSLVNDDIHSVFQDREGIIWIGTSRGFSRLDYKDPHNYSFRSFQLPRVNGKYEKNNSVNCFAEDAYGRLIIGTERSGLLFMNKRTFEFASPLPESGPGFRAIRSILSDTAGDFWIGTIGGLFIANHDFTVIKSYRNVHDNPTSITDNSIRSIFCDRHGSYWIGTFHGGVNIYNPLSKQFRHLSPRLSGRKINIKVASAITSDSNGNFWIGTEGNGLFFIDSQSHVRAHFRHDKSSNSLSHDNIKCLLLEQDEGLWIGTINGLDYYDFRSRRFIHFRNDRNKRGLPDDVIYDILKDKYGNLWVATYFGGLARIASERLVVENVYSHDPNNPRTLSSQTVTSLLTDSKSNLWVGTASGLNKQRPDGSFLRIRAGDVNISSQVDMYVTTIFEDRQNQIWIGTRGDGLHLLGKDGIIARRFSVDDGLPGNSVYGLQEDSKGHLWISTENGLSRFDPQLSSFKNYNRSDGLLCQEFNFNSCHRDAGGNFYFGGYNGVAWFHPDSIYENRIVPAVTFTDVRLFNKKIKADDATGILQSNASHETTLRFRHNQNIFSVEFAVLNFINSSKNQFAYKLEGFEEDWNYVKEPVATYMNLAPGTYTLMVKGANNDSFWNETPKTLSVIVFPPPWKTWWAYTAYCVAFLLLLLGWARINRKQITLRHELQLEHLEKVKQDELHAAKLNFFTNIAHEIRTPVTLIASPIEHLLETHTQNSNLRKELTVVKTNADRLMRLLNQLLDFQKQETGNVILKVADHNIVSFLRSITDSFREYAHSRKVSLSFHFSSPNIHLWFDREELSKVFFNLLVNALKFTPGGGKVSVSVRETDTSGDTNSRTDQLSFVRIVIHDNGLGIAPDELEKIFHRFYQAENAGIQDAGFGIGLALSKGIVDLHYGSISVESKEATATESGFTKFTILLRTGNNHFKPDQILSERNTLADFNEHESTIPLQEESRVNGEKALILLVEDDEQIRSYMRDMLASCYEVMEAGNGAEGVAIAVERLPDLIVSDIMMPFMDGIELVSKLKKDPRTNHIPIILLTARGTFNHQVEGLETGADDYLTKPFNINLLSVKIKNHLATRENLKEKYSRMVKLQPNEIVVQDPDEQFLQKLMRILEDNVNDSEFNVSSLVREIGMSRPVLFRKAKMLTGFSVIDLLRDVRLKKAEMLLKQKKLTISEIAFAVGFNDPKYFSKAFRNHYGKSPSQFIEELG